MKKTKKLVISKIEDTKVVGLVKYRLDVAAMSKKIKEYAVGLTPNLLTVKMALWDAARKVEEMMKSRRKE